jgi:hypothetical protein
MSSNELGRATKAQGKDTKTITLKAIELLRSKPTRVENKIINGHTPAQAQKTAPTTDTMKHSTRPANRTADGRALPRVLLDNGQGKFDGGDTTTVSGDSHMDISVESTPAAATQATQDQAKDHILLLPPIINTTRAIATGATTDILRKQNKTQQNKTFSNQTITSQWTRHDGAKLLDPENQWEQRTKKAEVREMAPQGLALQHEAADLLADWEKFGCPTQTGRDWTLAEIQAVLVPNVCNN